MSQRLTASGMTRPIAKPMATGRGAFTLIELLIVILIIGALMAIGLSVAGHVANTGKQHATQDAMKVLEATLTEYTAVTGAIPPKAYTFTDSDGFWEFAMVDGRGGGLSAFGDASGPDRFAVRPNPSLALYLAEVEKTDSVHSIVSGLDARLIQTVALAWNSNGEPKSQDFASRTVLDGWGNPIRFVHPAFDGGHGDFYTPNTSGGWSKTTRDDLGVAQKRGTGAFGAGASTFIQYQRSATPFDPDDPDRTAFWVGDADEGICTGGRPYFYSAGPDGDPGTRADNVYLTKPTFPAETMNLP